MADPRYTLVVDLPEPGMLSLALMDSQGVPVATRRGAFEGHVDNVLLTTVDNLLQGSRIDRSALIDAQPGPGVDKNSSFARVVTSFASALRAASARS